MTTASERSNGHGMADVQETSSCCFPTSRDRTRWTRVSLACRCLGHVTAFILVLEHNTWRVVAVIRVVGREAGPGPFTGNRLDIRAGWRILDPEWSR